MVFQNTGKLLGYFTATLFPRLIFHSKLKFSGKLGDLL